MMSSDLKNFIEKQTEKERYLKLYEKTLAAFSDGDYHIISSPGRAEICGNHTDHQNGFVVAAALDVDNVCIFKKTNDSLCTYKDDHFNIDVVDINDLNKNPYEENKAESIIRGVAKRFKDLGYKIGGFSAYCDSKVLVGSSMSSSACFEVMVVEIFNYLYNDDKIDNISRAKIARWAENNYFGKPCGLMDQMAVSVGNLVGIDFYDSENIKVIPHEFSFNDYGYDFFIINTKGSHADLTDEYAAIPGEMMFIASYFGKKTLSEVNEKDFYDNIKDIREKVKNDRAVLRAHHFYTENARAKSFNKALLEKNIDKIITIMNESGDSSYMYLQNVYPATDIKNQGISLAIAISKKHLELDDVCRVQGGGFAGTIQAIVKKERSDRYIKEMKKIFGDDSVLKVNINDYGTRTLV